MDKADRKGLRLVVVITVVCLAAGVAIGMSGPETEARILGIGSLVIAALASLKSGAMSITAFRSGRRLLALSWVILAVMLILLLMADVSHLSHLL